MVCLWIGYNMYVIISAKVHISKKHFKQSYNTELIPESSYKNEMTQTSNDDVDRTKVVYRNNRKDHSILRYSESGLYETLD